MLRQRHSVVLFPLLFLFLSLLPSLHAAASTQPIADDIDPLAVKKWAAAFGENLVQFARYVTAYDNFVKDFNSSEGIKLERANNIQLIQNITNKTSNMFAAKKAALSELVSRAEEARANFSDSNAGESEDRQLQYWNAKFLTTEPPEVNVTNFTNATASESDSRLRGDGVNGLLRSGKPTSRGRGENDDDVMRTEKPKVLYLATRLSCHFDNMMVNTSLSTVHIPTNIYDGDAEIVGEANWSEELDEVFRNNFARDPSLKWQYFASQSGLFRVYPGIKWPKRWNEDFYDCRTQMWYIQTAASPKDVVILVDNSGSMTGLRWQIAKKTIEGILNSLTANDFFAVVTFQATPTVISNNCGNDSLMQATAENKQYIKKELKNDKYQPKDIAIYPTALEFAFKLLRFNETTLSTNRTCDCNKAIMVISDGAPSGTDEVFRAYNSEKKIRVFSYLIGREISDAKEVRDMACNNKGYYVHVSTLADVAEYVQEYIHVMSRPMVITRDRPTIYTNIYIDPIRFPRGAMSHESYMENRLLITVAQPVFDVRNQTRDQGIFQGVMGTDVPLRDLKKHAPSWQLGPNAYVMMVTNNGHVVLHPMFRPKMFQDPVGMQRLPDYADLYTDIAEIELVYAAYRNASDFKVNYSLSLRTSLILAESSEYNLTVVGTYDSTNRRAFVRAHRYRTLNIRDAPYGLGLAMPQQYGYYVLDARVPRSKFSADVVELAVNKTSENFDQYLNPVEFCYVRGGEFNVTDPFGFIVSRLKSFSVDEDLICDMDFLENLFFDFNATKASANHWRHIETNETVDYVFIATRTGLIRYKVLQILNISDSFWSEILLSNKTVEAAYYRRTVENTASFNSAKDSDGTCETCFSTARLTVTVETKSLVMDDEEVGSEVEYNNYTMSQSAEAKVQKQRSAGQPSNERRKTVGMRNAVTANDTNSSTAGTAKIRNDFRPRALLTFTIPTERFSGIAISAPIAVVGAQIPLETMQSLAENTRIAPCPVSGNWTNVQPFVQLCKQRSTSSTLTRLTRNAKPPAAGGKNSVRQQGAGRRVSTTRSPTLPPTKAPSILDRMEYTFTDDDQHSSVVLQSLCDGFNITCFILDENGFVVLSRHVRNEVYQADSYVGRFFGEIRGHYWIVSELTDKVYRRVEFIDYQAMCQKAPDQKSDASSLLWQPFTWIGAAFQKMVFNFIIMLIETDINWMYQVVADVVEGLVRHVRDDGGAAIPMDQQAGSAEGEDSAAGESETISEEVGEDHSGETASLVKTSKLKEPCTEHMSLYYYTDSWRNNDTRLINGTDYIAARIPRTNLLLVVLTAYRTMIQGNTNCTAPMNYDSVGCFAPIYPVQAGSASETCFQPFRETPRMTCHKFNESENPSKCMGGGMPGSSNMRVANQYIVILLSLLAFIIR